MHTISLNNMVPTLAGCIPGTLFAAPEVTLRPLSEPCARAIAEQQDNVFYVEIRHTQSIQQPQQREPEPQGVRR
jgi:hypothetical protein